MVQSLVPVPRYLKKKMCVAIFNAISFFSITFSNLLLLQREGYWFCILIFSPSPLSLFLYSFINFSGGLFGFVLESDYIFHKWYILIFLCINSLVSSILSLPALPSACLSTAFPYFLSPVHNAQGFNFFTSLPTLVIFCVVDFRLFIFSHRNGYEVISCGFDLYFPDDLVMLGKRHDVFSCAYWPFVYLLWKYVYSISMFI